MKENDRETFSAQNELESVVVGRFVRTLENIIYKYMTLVSDNKCVYE